MLQQVWENIEYGINHVLKFKDGSYDHTLFLIALTVPYLFKDWKRVITLVTVFTIGHTISLTLAVYGHLKMNMTIVEFLIAISILVVAVFNVFTAGKTGRKERTGLLILTTLFFGFFHGLGFGREFNMLAFPGESKLLRLLEYAVGIEIAQLIIVFVVLFLGYIIQTIFRFSKRDWVLVTSSIVIGLLIPILVEKSIF